MTRNEFRNAIRKGQGRVIQCLCECTGEQYIDIIEHACTHHLAYDAQSDWSREDYMTEIADHVGGLKRFRQAMLSALETTQSRKDLSQLFGLARRLAAAGDADARTAMYARFRFRVRDEEEFIGALDIIELDGREGLRAVASIFGRECQNDPDYCPADVRFFTNEIFAKGQIETTLMEMAKHDPQVKAYLSRLQVDKADKHQTSARPSNEELERMSFEALMAQYPAGSDVAGSFVSHRWGKRASDTDIRKAAATLEVETDPTRLRLLIRIFRWRTFPGDPAVLLRLLDKYSQDRLISRPIEVALQNIEAPPVRAAALQQLRTGGNISRGLYLLCANYQACDADLILKVLPSDDSDADAIHDIGHVLLDLFDDERISDATDAFVWMWEHNPCSFCRERAFDRLNSIGCVPDWMREEAKFDCNKDLRAMGRGEIGSDD